MAERLTYPTKTPDINAPDDERLFKATEANEIRTVVNSHADDIEAIQSTLSTPTAFAGSFTSLTLLNTAFPTGANGAYAIIDAGSGATPQIALYDTDDTVWVISGAITDKVYVNSTANLPATGVENTWYITLDNFYAYLWYNAEYNIIKTPGEDDTPTLFTNNSKLITGIVARATSDAGANYSAQWSVVTRSFSPISHLKDAWYTNATTNQRLLLDFGRTITITKIVIQNYFNNTNSVDIVSGTGNAGINNCVFRAVTGDMSFVTTVHNQNLSELTTMYTGVVPQAFSSSDIFEPTITPIEAKGLGIDINTNHGSPSNLGVRKIWIYGF
ncbi:hypothetical protein EZY14_002790 [Kordia sp. TARA_039_SRF]|nr:hypothetical protein EZY14_002790 [Kordia sp. TARA_039_SRF]